MATVKLVMEVESVNYCRKCHHFAIDGVETTAGWDRGENWHCNKADKRIMGFVEWRDKVEIPAWCPLRS